MHRQALLTLLRQHQPIDTNEQEMTETTIAFVEQHPDCFDRILLTGHVTGSAWVVSPDRQQIVLIHHRKLDRWFQPGGHADGDPDVARVALKEAEEETGLTDLKLVRSTGEQAPIFDVDVHTIPARKEVPEHRHYDIRFMVEADPKKAFVQNEETQDIQWVSLKKVNEYTQEESIVRMIKKMSR
ncbi:NUDIX hydrolase [Spirosoma sp. KUDC1026]|uniref:NUDIX hydrolase n=1 Tax=Spirosoma sp. KUDC1026 TaxID=2745947 RepID=UPI00159B856B|nr:NUDIX hydrolase [Spirosoma sp. KUDC1026]QKZ14273.1 NUDIX hydrolase [Spirosoma sp. KUDC1026]